MSETQTPVEFKYFSQNEEPEPQTPDVEALIQELHEAREEATQAKEARDAWKAELEELLAWQRYQECKSLYKDRRSAARDIETDAKDALLRAAQNGHRHDAVHAVRTSTRFEYDEAEALAWAKAHLPEAVTLDKRTFEGYCKEAAGGQFLELPDFVETHEEQSVSIKRDLSEFVGKGGADAG